jgi:hypothetical protein
MACVTPEGMPTYLSARPAGSPNGAAFMASSRKGHRSPSGGDQVLSGGTPSGAASRLRPARERWRWGYLAVRQCGHEALGKDGNPRPLPAMSRIDAPTSPTSLPMVTGSEALSVFLIME